ncbi:hypothetical protein AK812_SmicGene20768 [Symbiodinium microadriaticum]|uniref:Uncharacterized protein n=1 Tax=Symbiodinium microadriaticum TaxID=2951 RepID=A0A1Q9DP47_SYMMI|nr:hypothetical protein AK812_SmicGene20768 [Symbiodinium microadriaticum]
MASEKRPSKTCRTPHPAATKVGLEGVPRGGVRSAFAQGAGLRQPRRSPRGDEKHPSADRAGSSHLDPAGFLSLDVARKLSEHFKAKEAMTSHLSTRSSREVEMGSRRNIIEEGDSTPLLEAIEL